MEKQMNVYVEKLPCAISASATLEARGAAVVTRAWNGMADGVKRAGFALTHVGTPAWSPTL